MDIDMLKNAKIIKIENDINGMQPAIFVKVLNNEIYMITATPNRHFQIAKPSVLNDEAKTIK